MAETRPLQTTLMSCFVTLVLSISSLSEDPNFTDRDAKIISFVPRFLISTGFSWFVAVSRLNYLGLVWLAMKNSEPVVSSAEEERNQGLMRKIKSWILRTSKTGIMTICPIIIHINFPPHGSDNNAIGNTIDIMVKEKDCVVLEAPVVEELCALVLKPSKSSPGDDVMNDMKQYYKYCCSSGGGDGSDVERNSGAAADDAERGDTMEGGGGDEIAGSNVRNYEGKFLYIGAGDALTRRIALLKLGLVPPYEQLRYLRKRSRFQTLVTVAQTLGFVIGLIERITQGLAISPLEALVSIFSVAAVLQMGLDLFTCASFNAPLFLHLTPSQFRNFILHPVPPTSTTPNIIKDFAAFFVTAIRVGIAIGFIIYFRRPHLVAASSFIVYSLDILASFMFYIFYIQLRRKRGILFCLTLPLSMLAVFALALANTVKDWKPFYNESAQTIFAWLLPHVFSN